MAPVVVTELPLPQAGTAGQAWSDRGGGWRQVEVDYPRLLVRGWSERIRRVWASLAFTGVVGLGWLIASDTLDPDETIGGLRPVHWLALVAVVLAWMWLRTLRDLASSIRQWVAYDSGRDLAPDEIADDIA